MQRSLEETNILLHCVTGRQHPTFPCTQGGVEAGDIPPTYSAPGWSLQIDTEECCDVLHASISRYLDTDTVDTHSDTDTAAAAADNYVENEREV